MNDQKLKSVPFYFLRHGQTDWNKDGRLMGQSDIPLNQTGISQAQEVAAYLKENHIGLAKIIASPLLRAKQTAQIIHDSINIPLEFNSGLREVRFGIAEGKFESYKTFHLPWVNGATHEGAESWIIFKSRVITALIECLEKEEKILIVAHGGVYTAIMDFLGYPSQESDNCVLYSFTPPNEKTNRWIVNC